MPPERHIVRATIGGLERELPLDPLPFTIGRRPTHSLAIPLPQVSRDHAQILRDGVGFALHDQGSTHGTLLNGHRVTGTHPLSPGDVIEFHNCPGVRIVFDPATEAASLFLTQMQKLDSTEGANEFDRLRLLLDFSQRMRSAGGLEEILSAMIDAALRLTGAERGFVFLRASEPGQSLRLATGRTAAAESLHDDSAISHSIVARADQAGEAVILNDTRQVKADLARSVVEQDLRTVVAIPLRDARDAEAAGVGVLYLDSHAASPTLGKISREMLDVLANDATQVVLNAELALRQEQSRQMEKELALAASIQQGLMATHLPTFDYCRLDGLSQACHQIGGDFFDAVQIAGDSGAVAIVLADVSGKGAAAALLAASLQGIVHSHLRAGSRLADIASMANQFICQRLEGEKYATMIIVRLDPSGEFEYLNCGHIPPVVTGPGGCRTLDAGNMPVGLVPSAEYASARHQLAPGERLLLVSDGVTEAANTEREMFGDQRLTDCMGHDFNVRALADEVHRFCQGAPLTDDLTLLEVRYR